MQQALLQVQVQDQDIQALLEGQEGLLEVLGTQQTLQQVQVQDQALQALLEGQKDYQGS